MIIILLVSKVSALLKKYLGKRVLEKFLEEFLPAQLSRAAGFLIMSDKGRRGMETRDVILTSKIFFWKCRIV